MAFRNVPSPRQAHVADRSLAKELLRELVEMEDRRGIPERWERVEGQAEEIRRMIRRMDHVCSGAVLPESDGIPSGGETPVHKSIWRRLVAAYRERKNRLIATALFE